ncbi:MAG: hypothetical protein U1E56_09340 [Bauldia sp.]|mgnify:CR=1 FL=1
MRSSVIAAAAAALMASTVVASADDIVGAVKTYDPVKRILTIESGQVFYVEPEVDFKFAPGARIKISYSSDHGDHSAYAIVASLTPGR